MYQRLFLGLFVLFLALSTQAQKRHAHPHGPKMSLTEMTETLELNSDQVEEITALQATTKAKLDEIRTAHEADRVAAKAAARAVRDEHADAVKGVLTTEQRTKLQAIHEEKRAAHQAWLQSDEHAAMRAEIKAYHQENIKPIRQAQRAKLEASFSIDEQEQLTELRALHDAYAKEERAARKERMETEGGLDRAATAKVHFREAEPEAWARLEVLATKHAMTIDALLAELEPKHQEWKADLQAIRLKYLPEGHPQPDPEQMTERRANRAEQRAERKRIRFLLQEANSKENRRPQRADVVTNVEVAPNPTTGAAQLQFEVLTASNLRIKVADEQGQVRQTIASKQDFDAGVHTIDIDLSDMQAGTYWVQLNGRGVAPQSVKVVVLK